MISKHWIINLIVLLIIANANGQTIDRPTLKAGKLSETITIDGVLNENDWQNAPMLDDFKTTIRLMISLKTRYYKTNKF